MPAQLEVSQPGDALEREADRVADTVLRIPEAGASPPAMAGAAWSAVQRTADVLFDKQLMAKRDGTGTDAAPASFGAKLSALSGGAPLPESARAYFEPRFGYDFSGVRVHTGVAAHAAARSVQARAFALGTDVVFGTGEYAPDSRAGRRLLAHELTHVVQQSRSAFAVQRVLRTSYESCGSDVTGVDDADARIDAARADAQRLLATARAAFPRMSSTTIRLVDRHFHCPSLADIRAIIRRLDLIESALPGLIIRCIPDGIAPCLGIVKAQTAEDGALEICPFSFNPDAPRLRLAVSLIFGAANSIGISEACYRREPCYDDFMVPASTMINNPFSYAWFAAELSGYRVPAPPTIPCRPLNTGVNVYVPADPAGIRRVTGYESPPAGSVILPVFADRSGNHFIYHDYPEAVPYLPGERSRYYFPGGRIP